MSDKTDELERRLATKRAERAKAEETQLETDLEARLDLEDTHGTIAAVKVSRFVAGHPTFALLKTPDATQYKRYKDQIHKAVDRKNTGSQQEAMELLAKAVWIYPAPENDGKLSPAQKAMLDVFPGLLTPMFQAAAALAEGKAETEGKD